MSFLTLKQVEMLVEIGYVQYGGEPSVFQYPIFIGKTAPWKSLIPSRRRPKWCFEVFEKVIPNKKHLLVKCLISHMKTLNLLQTNAILDNGTIQEIWKLLNIPMSLPAARESYFESWDLIMTKSLEFLETKNIPKKKIAIVKPRPVQKRPLEECPDEVIPIVKKRKTTDPAKDLENIESKLARILEKEKCWLGEVEEWRQKYKNHPEYHPDHPQEIMFIRMEKELWLKKEKLWKRKSRLVHLSFLK